MNSPLLLRCNRVREVDKPTAPADKASLIKPFIRAMSSAVAASPINGALTHDIDSYRTMGQQSRHIDISWFSGE